MNSKFKRYSSPQKLGVAWRDRLLTSEDSRSFRTGSYTLIANDQTIWAGDKLCVLMRRNDQLNIVLALRHGSLPLSPSGTNCLKYATEVPEVSGWGRDSSGGWVKEISQPRIVPTKVVRLDSLQDENLSSSDLATLQPLVWKSAKPVLDSLVRSFRRHEPGSYSYKSADKLWKEEASGLNAVGLQIPKEYTDKRMVAEATLRLVPKK